jgi:multidrug resistance efflux pump
MLLAGPRSEDVAVAAADLARAEAAETLLLAGTRKEDLAAAEARAAMARSDLALVEADLKEAVVVAPEKCVLEVLSVRRGDVLAPRAPVARLHRASDLWVKVFVPETEIGKVRVGQSAAATVDSFPGRKFAGKVSWIGAQAEFTPRNVQSVDERRHQVFAVRVVVADPEGVFKSGMAAEVVLGTE